LIAALAALAGLPFLHAQLGRRGAPPGLDQEYIPPPPDANEETEFYFARLAYTGSYEGRWGPDAWMIDSPKAERQFVQGVRRLTNLHVRSVEKYVRATDPDLFDYPWLYVVEPGQWALTQAEADALREYLLRGGFIMTDDFHGTWEWAMFMRGIRMIFPDRPVVEIESRDAVFHVLYDLDERFQVPGLQYLYTGRMAEMDGVEPHWRGIYDDKGRLMVAINFNMDLGDAWEWADLPAYPEKWTALAYRLGINQILYAMTH
jgi:hypothetical protein